MENKSRTKNVTRNVSTAMFTKFFDQFLNFVVRTIFIKTLTVEYLGINGLFNNILSFLSLAELGVGSAIIYLMYKPVAENDVQKICTYMNVYKKIYAFLGAVVFLIGISLTPFLNFFVAERPTIPESLEVIYMVYIIKTVSTYFFAYKQSIFIAHQRSYVINHNTAVFTMIKCVLESACLIIAHQFLVYLIIDMLINYVQNIIIAIKANKEYPYLKSKKLGKLTDEESAAIKKNVGAMFFHKIGAVVLNSSDNLILSKFIGIVTVGIYSNYSTILTIVKTVLWTVFDAIVPSVGNLCANSDDEQKYIVFRGIQLMNLWVSGFCTIALGVLINPFICLWIGESYLLPQATVWAIIISYYVQTNMRAIEMFRSATGLFYNDRFVPLIQCVINIVVSIIMVKFWGVAGVFVGTSCSVLLTGFWVQPYMVYRYIFKKPLIFYFANYIKSTFVTVLALFCTYFCANIVEHAGILAFVWKMACCTVIPNLIFVIVYWKSNEFNYLKQKVLQIIKR